jgi:heme exporter protein D
MDRGLGVRVMSLGDFLAMGGYGLYVWGSYVAAAALLSVEIVAVLARRKAARLAARDEIAENTA